MFSLILEFMEHYYGPLQVDKKKHCRQGRLSEPYRVIHENFVLIVSVFLNRIIYFMDVNTKVFYIIACVGHNGDCIR